MMEHAMKRSDVINEKIIPKAANIPPITGAATLPDIIFLITNTVMLCNNYFTHFSVTVLDQRDKFNIEKYNKEEEKRQEKQLEQWRTKAEKRVCMN